MIQTPEKGYGDDLPSTLDDSSNRRVLAQRKRGPDIVVIASVGFEDSAQVRRAEHHCMVHCMVHALSTNRADQPLGRVRFAKVNGPPLGDRKCPLPVHVAFPKKTPLLSALSP